MKEEAFYKKKQLQVTKCGSFLKTNNFLHVLEEGWSLSFFLNLHYLIFKCLNHSFTSDQVPMLLRPVIWHKGCSAIKRNFCWFHSDEIPQRSSA